MAKRRKRLKKSDKITLGILAIIFWPFTLAYLFIKGIFSLFKKGKPQNRKTSNENSRQTNNDPMRPRRSPPKHYEDPEPVADGDYEKYGLDDPTFSFSTVDGYKDKLKQLREQQREMVRNKIACNHPHDFYFNGDYKEGARVVNDWMKLMLRAFNGECDVIITRVSVLNIEASKEKILKSAGSINAIGQRMEISISQEYVWLKLDELDLAYEYQRFKEAEKERLRQFREEERERIKVEKELQERREKIYKDQHKIEAEISSLSARLATASAADQAIIQERIAELNEHTQQLNQDLAHVEEYARQPRAGTVYVISNIGSFGENMYKIGMTRRNEPMDRVNELGDASVPFRFDVHAFIFSEDAVALETALHHAFANRRVNLANPRREFFYATLDEIEAVVKQNFSKTVEFVRVPEAQEYRESVAIREQMRAEQRQK